MEVPGGETRKRGRSSGALPSPRPAPMNTEEEEDESINFSSATLQSRCTRSTPHDYLVQLNVSGRVFTTLASTLRAYPSKLQEWLDDGFRGLPRDPEGLPFIDRDSRNFHHLLHYLQGYGVPSKVEELVLLSDDAVYYGVEQLRRDLCVDTPTWRFNPGPGVSKDGIHFSTSSIVGLCGDVPLGLQLNHVIVFRVDKCELISVGVVAVENVKEDTALHEQRQSVSYRNTGELVQYWTDTPIFLSGTRYQQQDAISIKVQFVPAGSRPDVGAATTAGTSSAQGDGASGLEEDASIQRRAASTTSEVSPSSLPSAPKEAAAVASSGSTQFSASEMDAIITFNREDKVEFEVRWPAPVPPLQFAASLQGISLITILGAASMDEVHSPAIPTFSPDSLSVDGVPVTEATAMPRQPPVALARGASLFFNAPPDG